MKFYNTQALTFDDVTLIPNYSEVKSRTSPDITSQVGKYSLKTPFIASPMNTVCEEGMASSMQMCGGDGVIHRYMSIERQANIAQTYLKMDKVFYAIGATGDYLERAEELYKNNVRKFCIDVANGHSWHCIEATKQIKRKYPDIILMTGNVCTSEGFNALAVAGSDLVRVGVGSGAMCKTRLVTGHGVPQITALKLIKEEQEKHFTDVGIIADGGIRNSGDIVKAMVFADYVMLGSLLAGTLEAPGKIIKENGEEYKLYAGMASEEGRGLNDWFSRDKTSFVPEGESIRMKLKGSVDIILENLIGGLKVGMSYSGALNLKELREKATFITVSAAGFIEGTPHGKKNI